MMSETNNSTATEKTTGMMSMARTSKPFAGEVVNAGTVVHTETGMQNVLTLSDDFKVPETPAPHWQVVDAMGNAYLLNRLMIEGNKFNKTIMLPSYIKNIAKVQIWCAWAEAVLGETTFTKARI